MRAWVDRLDDAENRYRAAKEMAEMQWMHLDPNNDEDRKQYYLGRPQQSGETDEAYTARVAKKREEYKNRVINWGDKTYREKNNEISTYNYSLERDMEYYGLSIHDPEDVTFYQTAVYEVRNEWWVLRARRVRDMVDDYLARKNPPALPPTPPPSAPPMP